MRRAIVLAHVLGIGCGGTSSTPQPDAAPADAAVDAAIAPVLRNPVDLPDAELAHAALQLLGGNVEGAATESCNSCHGITRQNLRYWRALSDTASATCLTDLSLGTAATAQTTIDCVRSMPALPASDFASAKLGIYSTATHLSWFEFAFWRAYGSGAAARHAELTQAAGMPKSGTPWTQAQFDIVAEWFVRGLPALEDTLPHDPPPSTCQPAISSEVGAHVTAMATQGWRAVNASSLMAMHGCGAATDPAQCLQGVRLGADQTFGAGWDLPGRGHLRVLADVDYASSYWTRSSPDGRFVAHGVRNVPGSYVLDLQRGALRLPINATYDPNWFPDNSGFVFQGGARNVCGQSVLTSNPASVSMTESACSSITSIGLYEHVGRALGGGDFFAIDSKFVSDDGGHEPTLRDPLATFDATAKLGFIPMLWTGTAYQGKPQVTVATPFEGDSVLAPSARLVISRVAGPDDRQLGFVLRKVNATLQGTSYAISTPEIARYCISGGKPGFSYDERWIVFHRYVTAADAVALGFTGPSDPAFAPYLTAGAANLFLMELATGEVVRLTHMQPGQYALFPHFRSDGWIYAAIRDRTTGREYMVASDAALLAE